MAKRPPDPRDLFQDALTAAICLWAGYFLSHSWGALQQAELALIAGGALVSLAGAYLALTDEGRRPLGAMLLLGGLVAAGLGSVRGLGAVALFLVVGAARIVRAPRSLLARFALGWCFAGLALAAGLLAAEAISLLMVLSAALIACHVALVDVLRSREPVARGVFIAVVAGMLVILLLVGTDGLKADHSLVVLVLCAWPAVRALFHGSAVLRRYGADSIRSFAGLAVADTALLAAALLTARVGEGQRALSDLSPPLVLAAAAIVLTRIGPALLRRKEPRG